MMYKTMWENDKADGTVYYDSHFEKYMMFYYGDEIVLGDDEKSAYDVYSEIMSMEYDNFGEDDFYGILA